MAVAVVVFVVVVMGVVAAVAAAVRVVVVVVVVVGMILVICTSSDGRLHMQGHISFRFLFALAFPRPKSVVQRLAVHEPCPRALLPLQLR